MTEKHKQGDLEATEAPSSVAIEPAESYHIEKTFLQKFRPVFAAGAGLFSDGYLNNVIGSVSTILATIYGKEYTQSPAKKDIASIAFVGYVVGQLIFGFLVDRWSRKNTLLVVTLLMIAFAGLAAGSYGAGGSIHGMFAALTAWRFFVGVALGGEKPTATTIAAESAAQLHRGSQNRWFILVTNFAIDFGFVIGAFMPYIFVVICTEDHLRLVWRLCLGFGCIPPLSLLYLRYKLDEPEHYKKNAIKKNMPYLLFFRMYWPRLVLISAIYFVYDFVIYGFGIYATTILRLIINSDSMATTFGWNTVINLFYLPGALLGAPISDWLGPKWTTCIGLVSQSAIGFIMAGCYSRLATSAHIAAFAVVYGIFLSFGELGPGNNIPLLVTKTSATSTRGQYYAIAAGVGKLGAFVSTYIFPYIQAAGHTPTQKGQYPFFVGSSICLLSAFLVTLLPKITPDSIENEDRKWRQYLELKGYDTSNMGL